jgi:hypothetical protein
LSIRDSGFELHDATIPDDAFWIFVLSVIKRVFGTAVSHEPDNSFGRCG